MSIKGLLPAAGLGNRLSLPFPKELIELDGYALILHSARMLSASGVDSIVVVLREGKEVIAEYLEHYSSSVAPLQFVFQPPPFGSLLHAIQAATPLLENDYVHFLMPDTVLGPNPFLTTNLDQARLNLHCFEAEGDSWCNFGVVDKQRCWIVDKPSKFISNTCWGAISWPPTFTRFLVEQNDLTSAINQFGFEFHLSINSYRDFGIAKSNYVQAKVA